MLSLPLPGTAVEDFRPQLFNNTARSIIRHIGSLSIFLLLKKIYMQKYTKRTEDKKLLVFLLNDYP
ncbi:hypothetical protein M116_3867 [Bacteroides fragilis str. 3719 A10]|nr:hypothetical protein M116_3867 [Bacteroides fragilis str. 3719 A10]